MKKGLGRGLDSIFADNYIEVASKEEGIQTLRISQIEPKADQPRKHFDEEALIELSDSIKNHGLLQPIIVRESGEKDYYQIIAGERRWRASKLAGLTEIPAIVMQADALQAAEIAIIENIQRQDLNAYEEAAAYSSLMEQYDLTQEEVAEKVGKSRSAVANAMRLLDLPEDVLEMLKTGDISAGHARALLGLKNKDIIVDTAEQILVRSLSVRDTEALVKKLNKDFEKGDEQAPVQPDEIKVDYIKDLEKKAMHITGKRVKIKTSGKVSTVEIDFYGNDDLEDILIKLCGKGIIE
ncbi:MAG: ParB/RepB/Spo0J family partition protein [Ruminococcaceae bacterium]|nr:ParB/RepB/Spo0J family partition protein [Oscillospiraceae bacterium]